MTIHQGILGHRNNPYRWDFSGNVPQLIPSESYQQSGYTPYIPKEQLGYKPGERTEITPEEAPRYIRPAESSDDGGSWEYSGRDDYLNFDSAKKWFQSGREHGYYGSIQDAFKAAKGGNTKAKAALDSWWEKDPRAGKQPLGILGKGLDFISSKLGGENISGIPINRMDYINTLLGTGSGPVNNPNAYNIGIENVTPGLFNPNPSAINQGINVANIGNNVPTGVNITPSPQVDSSDDGWSDPGEPSGLDTASSSFSDDGFGGWT